MAASKGKGTKNKGTKKAPASTGAARTRAAAPVVPDPLDPKKATIYPRVGFETVGKSVGTEWAANPDILELKRASPDQLLNLIAIADSLKKPEDEARMAYEIALGVYNKAHSKRLVALDASWAMFRYVNEQSKTEAKFDAVVAGVFKPMHNFMAAPAAKAVRTKKRKAKKTTTSP